jgi:hypothetical protein
MISCCAATGPKSLTLPGVAEMYPFLMNTWNTLLVSYQQTVYNNTLHTVKCQIQQAENPTPDIIISMESAIVDNAILIDNLTSEVAVEQFEMGSTEPNIPMDNNCTDDQLNFGIPWCTLDYDHHGDESNEPDTFPTTSRRPRPTTAL